MVTRTRLPIAIRCAIGSGPNAENSGQNRLRFFRVPSAGDVELRYSPGQDENAVSFCYSEPVEDVRESVGDAPKLGVGVIANLAGFADPADGEVTGPGPRGVPINRLVSDVQPACAGQARHLAASLFPGELGGAVS